MVVPDSVSTSFAGLGYTVTLAASIASAPDVPIRNADGWNADD